MNDVTKEWLWLMAALILSVLTAVVLLSVGVRPRESLPLSVYVILSPIALVYLVRLTVWAIARITKIKWK
jgi:hypothetical protein